MIKGTTLKTDLTEFRVGDTVRVFHKIIEGTRERVQIFNGIVIAMKGTGINRNFTVRRIAFGEGMEKVFPFHSPRIEKIEVTRHGKVRRSKLYYLRSKVGKKAKVKEEAHVYGETPIEVAAAAQPAATPAASV